MAGLHELPPLASNAPTSMLACETQWGFDLFDAVLGSPVADMPGAPASPARCWPSPAESSHQPPHHAEGAVQRCLFSSADTACCSALPRLIVPAAPFSACYGGSPMQLPSTPASQAADIRRRGSRARQQQEEPGMQEWLANMELALSVGSRNNRGLPGDSSAGVSPTAAPTAVGEGSHQSRNTLGVDLPPPAFALLGVLQE